MEYAKFSGFFLGGLSENEWSIIDMILAKKQLGVKNLILYHTEEKTLANRKENYTREAAENFKGRIFVPDDLEVIEL